MNVHWTMSKASYDWTDEYSFAYSEGPYYIDTKIINTQPTVDLAMTYRIQSNPKILNTKAPHVMSTCWGIYDVNKRETVFGRCLDAKHEVASVTKLMTAYTVTEIARKYRLKLDEV